MNGKISTSLTLFSPFFNLFSALGAEIGMHSSAFLAILTPPLMRERQETVRDV
jgi:hypothetical protein